MKRPISISIIAWLTILFGAFSLCPMIFVVSSDDTYEILREFIDATGSGRIITLPFEVYILFSFAGSIVSIVAGMYMLMGRNWARALLLVWWTAGLILVLIFYGFSFILGLNFLIYLLVLYLLTRKRCLTYFGLRSADRDA